MNKDQSVNASQILVEGEFSGEFPIADADWIEFVRYEVNSVWYERAHFHPLNGYFADKAGSKACLALGHSPDPEEGWDPDEHPTGWGNEPLCLATRYGIACTECESDDCPVLQRRQVDQEFWSLFSYDRINKKENS